MIAQALAFLVDTLGTLLIVALLLRFWLQAARAPFNNPLSGLLASVTNWGVKPLRRVVPGFWGLDLATLLLAWLVAWALNIVLSLIDPRLLLDFAGSVGPGPAGVSASVGVSAVAALVQLVRLFIYMMIAALIVQMLLSWMNPHSPMAPLKSRAPTLSKTRMAISPRKATRPTCVGVDLAQTSPSVTAPTSVKVGPVTNCFSV